jgi:hypothetical protein
LTPRGESLYKIGEGRAHRPAKLEISTMAYNSIPTACTSEKAPFQQFDLWWIDQFTSRGIDMPCEAMGTVLLMVVVGITLSLMVVGLIIVHYATRNTRNPLDAMARRNRRNRRARERASRNHFNAVKREIEARELRWAREDAARHRRFMRRWNAV